MHGLGTVAALRALACLVYASIVVARSACASLCGKRCRLNSWLLGERCSLPSMLLYCCSVQVLIKLMLTLCLLCFFSVCCCSALLLHSLACPRMCLLQHLWPSASWQRKQPAAAARSARRSSTDPAAARMLLAHLPAAPAAALPHAAPQRCVLAAALAVCGGLTGVCQARASLWGPSHLDRVICGAMKLPHFAADLRISHRLAGYHTMLACASTAHLLMLLGRAA
jgi:hypothetical protein